MNKKMIMICIGLVLSLSLLLVPAASAADIQSGQTNTKAGNNYSMEQALSDNAQLSTIAFSGLAFITGSEGADSFMPPGKVADFFGFQYMRDVDVAGYGHNTQFLSRVANNVLYILNAEQKQKLVVLAKEQATIYTNFAYNRFTIMDAFRRNLEGDIPEGSDGLDIDAVGEYTSNLYQLDAELSYNRAVTVGEIIESFSDEQISYLDKMEFNDFNTWPDVSEDADLKKTMTNTEFVAVMTYASELFSWYKGSVDADAYFCPERHGTYFGGFYMKDYPAMNNPDYFISTAITGDKGKEFLEILDDDQRALIEGIIEEQRDDMKEIAEIRETVSAELRKAMTGGTVDKDTVYKLIERYGELDGRVSALYATRFSEVNETLTDEQMAKLIALRDLDVIPKGAYFFSTPIETPEIPDTDFMFGVESMPDDAGLTDAPQSFGTTGKEIVSPTENGGSTDNTNKPPRQREQREVKVKLNDKELSFDAKPFVDQNNRIQVPARVITEELGAEIIWEPSGEKNTILITKGDTVIKIKVGQNSALINGVKTELDSTCFIKDGRVFVPVRFIAEILGEGVNWDANTSTVSIQ